MIRDYQPRQYGQYTLNESGHQLLLTTRLAGCRVVKKLNCRKSNCLVQLEISRRIVTIQLGRDDPFFEESTRQLEVSGRDGKIKTSMNTEVRKGYAAKKY